MEKTAQEGKTEFLGEGNNHVRVKEFPERQKEEGKDP